VRGDGNGLGVRVRGYILGVRSEGSGARERETVSEELKVRSEGCEGLGRERGVRVQGLERENGVMVQGVERARDREGVGRFEGEVAIERRVRSAPPSGAGCGGWR
jgi:hypothetical protein